MTPSINLRHLRAFIAVAEFNNITRAAETLYRAQSAVTRSIHELETSLGVDLFERRATGMLLTAYGQALLVRAKRAAEEFERARAEIHAKTRDEHAKPNLGAPIFSMLFNEYRLQTFVTLVQLRHMPTVANLLKISQPAVSASIRELEASLQISLFNRSPRGMLPTEAGEALAFRVKRALAELRHVDADIAALKGHTKGIVTVGALPLGRSRILPMAIAKVVAAHPSLRISTVEGPFDVLAAGLRSADIDFILGALRPPSYASDLQGEPLLQDKMALVVRAGHPLAKMRRVRLQDLLSAQWILPRPDTPARILFEKSIVARGGTPPVEIVETSDLAIVRGLLLNSDMVTVISPHQLHYEREAGVLTTLDFDLPETSRWIGLIYRAESRPSPGAIALMQAVREVVSATDK